MNKIEIIDHDSGIKYNTVKIEEFCLKVLEKLNIENWDFCLTFCDDSLMEQLNKTYRKKKGSTDVLTFCESDTDNSWVASFGIDNNYYAGDIIISIQMLSKNAARFMVDEEEELKRLLIHGILHLTGMDHKTNKIEEKMLVLQEEYIKQFGDFKF